MSTPPLEPVPPEIVIAPEPVYEAAVAEGPGAAWDPQFAPVAVPEPVRETPGFVDLLVFAGILLASFLAAMVLGGTAVAVWAAVHHITLASLTASKGQQIAFAIPFEVLFYALAFAICIPAFRLRWRKSFGSGIHWNLNALSHRAGLLIIFGVALSVVINVVSSKLVKMPTDALIYELFKSATVAWIATVFGALIAPAAEEIAFRGFLLPVFQRYTGRIVAVALTSAIFALLHANQIGHAWGAVGMLFLVSVILCEVRLRFNSVAASTLVHMSYNSALFSTMIYATGGYRHFDKILH